MDNTIDLVEIEAHLKILKGILDKGKGLPEDAKSQLKTEIEHWENKLNEHE